MVVYIGNEYFISYKNHTLTKIAINKFNLIENHLNNKLKKIASVSQYIVNDDIPKLLHKNYQSGEVMDASIIEKLKFIIFNIQNMTMFVYVDKDDREILRFEKYNSFEINDVKIIPKKSLRKEFNDLYFEISKLSVEPFFSLIINDTHIHNKHNIKPFIRLYFPVFDDFGNYVGTLISEYDASMDFELITMSKVSNIVIYDSSTKILYNKEEHVGSVYGVETTLLDNFFNYREMLHKHIYNDGYVIAKLLNIEYNFLNNIGVYMTYNGEFNIQHNQRFHNDYYFYFVFIVFVLFFIIILVNNVKGVNKVKELKQYIVWLETRNEQLINESLIDELTGISNKKNFDEKINEIFDTYERYNQKFSILVFDIENLSFINETYGRYVGDDIIKIVVDNINRIIRKSDIMIRYTGNIFVIILPNTEEDFSITFSKKITEVVESIKFEINDKTIPIRVNVGISTVKACDKIPHKCFKRAHSSLKKKKLESVLNDYNGS